MSQNNKKLIPLEKASWLAGIGGLIFAIFVYLVPASNTQDASKQPTTIGGGGDHNINLIGNRNTVSINHQQEIQKKTTRDLRFKVIVNDKDVSFNKIDSKIRVKVKLHFQTTTTDNLQAATVFIGYLNMHDENLFDINRTPTSCADTPSCLGLQKFNNIKIIRGGDNIGEIIETVFFDIPIKVKFLRIHWFFYQKEADGGICDIDSSKQMVSDSIPDVAVFDESHKKLDALCYYSEDRITLPVHLTNEQR
ncbi:MAG: hypothetical protein WCH01_20825 [Methylococcaceae bacterium]